MDQDQGRGSPLRAAWTKWTLTASLGVIVVGALVLRVMGRRLWCTCGLPVPWSWDIWSLHNSQHLIDPYTFTHVLHGALYYALLWLVFRSRWPSARAFLAVFAEVAWEIAENSDAVIRAYRESTIALNYHGDSILNSLADVAAFALGYTGASWLSVRLSVTAFVAVETALLLTIRDSLLLNILMLLHPIQAIKAWQTGG